jgi:hypothetical protein
MGKIELVLVYLSIDTTRPGRFNRFCAPYSALRMRAISA